MLVVSESISLDISFLSVDNTKKIEFVIPVSLEKVLRIHFRDPYEVNTPQYKRLTLHG